MSERQARAGDEASAGRDRSTMPLMGHLIELRGRILRASFAIVVGFFVAWTVHVQLYDLLIAPIRDAMADNGLFSIKALQITESIGVYVKLSLFGGLMLASPFVFYQIWAFIAPGLEDEERASVVPVISASVVFFVVGATFCYLIVLPFMTDFLIKMTLEGQGLSLEPTLQSSFSYALWLMLAFGVVFELPVFMYFLSTLGLVNAKGLWSFYRYWIVIAAIIGAVLTPTPDPINQALMTGPLVVLYGLGVGISWLVAQDRSNRRGLPMRATAVLLLLLSGMLLIGATKLWDDGRRAPLQDIPADVAQLVGAHPSVLPELRQRVQSRQATKALGPTAMIDLLGLRDKLPSTLWLARFSDGVALVLPLKGAPALVRRVAKQREVSLVRYAGGPSALFALPHTSKRWRVAAPAGGMLWVGHDAALAHLAAVRRGEQAAMTDDPVLIDAISTLRSSGPIWSLSRAQVGISAWLPGKVLADTVSFASATVDKRAERIELNLKCKGPDAARELRTRIATWVADSQTRSNPAPSTRTRSDEELRGRLEELARLLARGIEAAAAIGPQGNEDLVQLLDVSAEANRLADDLTKQGRPVPDNDEPRPSARPEDTLASLVAPPAVSTVLVQDATVTWTVEAGADQVLSTLFAPSPMGLNPQAVKTELNKFAPSPQGLDPLAVKTTQDKIARKKAESRRRAAPQQREAARPRTEKRQAIRPETTRRRAEP